MKNAKPLQFSLVFLFYGLIALITMLWDWISRGSALFAWQEAQTGRLVYWVLGAFFVIFYVVITEVIAHYTDWAKQLYSLLRQLLTPMSYFQIIVVALVSGFIEEWFFRGLLLSHFGVILSSIIFALCHLILSDRLWVWSIWSFFMGIVFCLFLKASDSLLLVSMMHAGMNGIVIWLLNLRAHDHASLASSTSLE